jgi:hypothetical protein
MLARMDVSNYRAPFDVRQNVSTTALVLLWKNMWKVRATSFASVAKASVSLRNTSGSVLQANASELLSCTEEENAGV